MSDAQSSAANRVARELAGSAVDSGAPPRASADVTAEKPHAALFVRLPGDGYGEHRFAKEVGAILSENGVFRRDRVAVAINRESASVEPMSVQRFRTYCSKHMITARFIFDEKTGAAKPIERTMSVETARSCIESDWFIEQQRSLRRVNMVRMPVLRSDGRIELLPEGYDAETCIFTMPAGIMIDASMTLAAARDVMDELLREFPFGDYKEDNPANQAAGVVGLSRSKAVHIANMVSLYAAGLMHALAYRMHFVYVANAQRSGKTLLAKTAIVPIFGPAHAVPKPESEDDFRKLLTTMAVTAAPYLFLDDLDGLLRSQALNSFMTAPTWTDRKMGTHGAVSAMKETVVIITGNNLSLSTDIANRSLRCNLYTEEFDAQHRKIERVIDEEFLARTHVRTRVLSALWCFIREWDKAGRPKSARVLRGFEQWSELFGGIVIHAGFGDPLEPPPADDYSGDMEAADMSTLLERLVADIVQQPLTLEPSRQTPQKKEFTFDELVSCALANDCFSWMMDGARKRDKESDEERFELNQRSKSALGKLFSAKYGGRRFRLKDGRVARFGHRGRNRHKKYLVQIL